MSIGKHHTVNTADLYGEVGPAPPPKQRNQQSATTFRYMGVPPTFTDHLHPTGLSRTKSAIGSATGKRRYLSLPLLELDSSEVDSCSSTDISPSDVGPLHTGGLLSVTYPGTRLLNPGEVYYFAPNSCVVCVERDKMVPTRIQVSMVLDCWIENCGCLVNFRHKLQMLGTYLEMVDKCQTVHYYDESLQLLRVLLIPL